MHRRYEYLGVIIVKLKKGVGLINRVYGKRLLVLRPLGKLQNFWRILRYLYTLGYYTENIHVDFDNFDHIIGERTSKLIKGCEYGNDKKDNSDGMIVYLI